MICNWLMSATVENHDGYAWFPLFGAIFLNISSLGGHFPSHCRARGELLRPHSRVHNSFTVIPQQHSLWPERHPSSARPLSLDLPNHFLELPNRLIQNLHVHTGDPLDFFFNFSVLLWKLALGQLRKYWEGRSRAETCSKMSRGSVRTSELSGY